jgi:hypothetical protein
MNRLEMIKVAVIVGLVFGALGYGGHQAVAGSRMADCLYEPPLWLGSCESTSQCDLWCRKTNGSEWGGLCNAGCCYCYM